jgi:hypothetical protein
MSCDIILRLDPANDIGRDGHPSRRNEEAIPTTPSTLGGSRIAVSQGQGTMQELVDCGANGTVLRLRKGLSHGVHVGIKADGQSHGFRDG